MIATVLSELLVSIYQLSKVRNQLRIRSLFSEVWKYLVAALLMGVSVRVFINVLPLSNFLALLGATMYGALIYTLALVILRPKILLQMISSLRGLR